MHCVPGNEGERCGLLAEGRKGGVSIRANNEGKDICWDMGWVGSMGYLTYCIVGVMIQSGAGPTRSRHDRRIWNGFRFLLVFGMNVFVEKSGEAAG